MSIALLQRKFLCFVISLSAQNPWPLQRSVKPQYCTSRFSHNNKTSIFFQLIYGAIQVLRNADGGGGVRFSGEKRYEANIQTCNGFTSGAVVTVPELKTRYIDPLGTDR